MNKIIYLDNAATTALDRKIAKKVNAIITKNYANPSSQHSSGREAKGEIEIARKKIAEFINAESEEIIFTSGGTESNNFALKGFLNSDKKHIITSNIEHPCVLETCKFLEKQGFEIDYIGVNESGIINPGDIKKAITPDTLLVSIMHINNEIGTIQPIDEIGKICREQGVYFHTDAVQSFAKIPIDVKKMNIDLMSVSGHKINAPKGIGFLYIGKDIQKKIIPLLHGGGQEFELRSGTENTSGIIFLANAIDIKKNKQKIEKARDYLINEILKIPGTRLNGSQEKRVYNNINISFYGIEGESLMLLLDKQGIAVSTGSACSSHKLEESYVLRAINTPDLYIHGSLRISLDANKPIKKQDADYVIKSIKQSADKLRKISPFKLQEEK